MGEIRKIVVDHVRVEELPEPLRRGLADGQIVRVTVETEVPQPDRPRRSMMSYIGSGKGAYKSPDDADRAIRELRDEWE